MMRRLFRSHTPTTADYLMLGIFAVAYLAAVGFVLLAR